MTRKDFILIAKALRDDRPGYSPLGVALSYDEMTEWQQGSFDQWNTTVFAMAKALSDASGFDLNGNRRFDRERFLAACGTDAVR